LIYPAVTLKKATEFVVSSQGGNVSAGDFVELRGSGPECEDILQNLDLDIRKALSTFGAITPKIDSVLRKIIHSHLCNLELEILSDRDFWRYLSAVRYYDITLDRHPKSAKSNLSGGVDSNLANFGALREDIKESFIFRLFLGADLAYDASNKKDPYHLTKIHDVDLWQSHIIRVMSGDNDSYARALLMWFRDKEEWYKNIKSSAPIRNKMTSFSDGLEIRHLRDLVKRIRRLRSNIIHEFLDFDEIRAMIDEQATASLEAIESWGKVKAVKQSVKKRK